MSPEFGSTCAIFPIDEETIRYLELTGRGPEQIALVEAYAKAQGLWRVNGAPAADYSAVVELDLSTVEPSLAGPKRPQDRVPLRSAKQVYQSSVKKMAEERAQKNPQATGTATAAVGGESFEVRDGAVLIAAITSCTNTSNPAVLVAAGLLARNANARGLKSKPWVKTSLAPGSRVVTDYLQKAGLLKELEALGFYTVGYGCTTCIGNSGPLKPAISEAVKTADVVACSVLSGNRNFEGRVHPEIKMNFLASPPLVVAYALAGSLGIDITTEPLGQGKDGKPVYLKDVWPSAADVAAAVAGSVDSAMFKKGYANVFLGDANWSAIKTPAGKIYSWDGKSTYVKNPPYFDGITMTPAAVADIKGARALAVLGDSVTTDHISPAGNISKSSPAAKYLVAQGVQAADFNSYGARRGNHEVMMRGTFANIRLRNLLLPGTEGGVTLHIPSGEQLSIFDAAVKYKAAGTPLVVLAGKEYGTGSSRDWAAKGTMLLGVKAVIAESFERIHRSNLIGMGVLPLQYKDGQNAKSLGLTGKESFEIVGLDRGAAKSVKVIARSGDGNTTEFEARLRIDTPKELDYYQHGGILQYVLRQLASASKAA
jgi:aconitate hydratase